MTADAAAALIPDGARICMALGVAQPPALLEALAARAARGEIEGASLYYLLSTATAGQSVLRRELNGRLRPMSLFHSSVERALDVEAAKLGASSVDILPVAFSRAPKMLCDEIGVDTLVTQVAPMDANGEFSLGTNIDYAHAAARRCQRVIVEVNRHMPRTRGVSTIPLSAVTAIVEHDRPLVEIPSTVRRPEDDAIAAIIAGLIDDGACLQMGIGAVPEAVCAALRNHRHLGIHTELMTPGLAALMKSGVVDNSRKTLHPGKTVFTFAMGDAPFYDFIGDHPDIEGHPVSYVNDPAVIARNANMVSVNATLEIDLQGACNSEVMNGRQYSAAGGQLDFVRGASAAPGGKSIIACHSTAAGGTVSRIVRTLSGPVTTPRNDIHVVVTEFGAADLRGKSIRERAEALTAIAHPRFRDQLSG
ncbi:acetyl-CoA hydrolase/transferase C-terminal domain-containing protein [Sphingomonas sp. CA1-15]|uniref:Acetyl-CoA hydrolase/transferase C-terminal domain-containing protein n=2 Tax=Sphingomonas immobilis TaxID=3063997 RepID=A0ABT9A0R8_9SPHN|nr:acetyl-CoA hydrolase/transferase C-terminal domain-containing protein [Sphingomonas sp. CA1-15]MDO7843415.1 acetyl-CoA hydrolase/transferase C-terminal domain-containing protein [Sphingomonas sp. CA1-15]